MRNATQTSAIGAQDALQRNRIFLQPLQDLGMHCRTSNARADLSREDRQKLR